MLDKSFVSNIDSLCLDDILKQIQQNENVRSYEIDNCEYSYTYRRKEHKGVIHITVYKFEYEAIAKQYFSKNGDDDFEAYNNNNIRVSKLFTDRSTDLLWEEIYKYYTVYLRIGNYVIILTETIDRKDINDLQMIDVINMLCYQGEEL